MPKPQVQESERDGWPAEGEHHDHELLWTQEPGYRLAVAQRDRYREALERIARQGLGKWDQDRKQLMGATGEPWMHWASLAEEALDA